MNEETKRLIFHIDVNSAFISWESMRRVRDGESDLRLVPSVVGGDPNKRSSIVSAKSIPAKAYGINTGEPVSMALRKCPELVWVRPDFTLYLECSKAFKDICRQYCPVVESFSIDEVFMDMTGMGKLYPDPIATAYEIKDKIREELGFTVNVGVGENKLLAKMASDFEKPDKVHTLFLAEIREKMWPLPVGELFMVGKSSAKKLTDAGIKTIGELANANLLMVQSLLGEKMGRSAWNSANGRDDSPVSDEREDAKSFSVETTVEDDIEDFERVERILLSQADIVAARIRREEAKCGCIAVSYKMSDFRHRSHQQKLQSPTDVTMEIYEMACRLFREFWDGQPLRLIGLSLSDIDRDGFEQMSFFQDEKKEKLKKLDSALDSIRGRFGSTSVRRASTIGIEERMGRRHRAESSKKPTGNTAKKTDEQKPEAGNKDEHKDKNDE